MKSRIDPPFVGKPLTGETDVTDIELLPDGRIFVFGTSIEVLEVLNQLRTRNDDEIDARLKNRHVSFKATPS